MTAPAHSAACCEAYPGACIEGCPRSPDAARHCRELCGDGTRGHDLSCPRAAAAAPAPCPGCDAVSGNAWHHSKACPKFGWDGLEPWPTGETMAVWPGAVTERDPRAWSIDFALDDDDPEAPELQGVERDTPIAVTLHDDAAPGVKQAGDV